MENERDRPSWPREDPSADAQPPEPDWTASDDAPREERPSEEPVDAVESTGWTPATDAGVPAASDAERDAAPAEIESWPSQEPVRPTEPAAADASSAWPTEPPAAGSATADTWPTSAPERGEPPAEPAWSEPAPGADEVAAAAAAGGAEDRATTDDGWSSGEAEPSEPAPEEVEAYPAATPTDAGAVAAAAASAPAHAVPDAEGATGESTQCPRCGTENRPGLSFCRNCGQRLIAAGVASTVERPGVPEGTMACPRCGTHNRAGVAFCQNCGANLRGTADGYVPPAAVTEPETVAEPATRGAVLGPVVLLLGLAGMITGYLLPFLYGGGSLFDRAWGPDGYGAAFWSGYPEVAATLADQAYFGLAGPVPLLGVLLLVLAIAGFVRAAPGTLQSLGLGIALLWSVGLIVLFLVVEVLGAWDGDLVGLLRALTPAGIIFFLSGLIVVIGVLTRFSRG